MKCSGIEIKMQQFWFNKVSLKKAVCKLAAIFFNLGLNVLKNNTAVEVIPKMLTQVWNSQETHVNCKVLQVIWCVLLFIKHHRGHFIIKAIFGHNINSYVSKMYLYIETAPWFYLNIFNSSNFPIIKHHMCNWSGELFHTKWSSIDMICFNSSDEYIRMNLWGTIL